MTFRDIFYMLLGITMGVLGVIAAVAISSPGVTVLCCCGVYAAGLAFGEWMARTADREAKP